MATQEVAHGVPHLDTSDLITADKPFWVGPDSMVAPHLPVGSPEREALFKELGKTFSRDSHSRRLV